MSRAKHYLFDIGVTNQLCARGEIQAKSEFFGDAFEHFIILEMRRYLSYRRSDLKMSYWRSLSKFEVDLICGKDLAIEIKATDLVSDKHLKEIRALKEDDMFRKYIVVSCDAKQRVTDDGILILPWSVLRKRPNAVSIRIQTTTKYCLRGYTNAALEQSLTR